MTTPLVLDVYHPVLLVSKAERPLTAASAPNDGTVVQPRWVHLLLLTSTILPFLCPAQNSGSAALYTEATAVGTLPHGLDTAASAP